MSSNSPVGRLNKFLKRLASGAGRRRRIPAGMSQEAAEASAAALFTLMLGRAPEPSVDLAARAEIGWSGALGRLLASLEFQEQTLDALAAGRPFPQMRLGVAPPADLLREAAALAERPKDASQGASGKTGARPTSEAAREAVWADRLAGPFDDWPGFFAALLSDRPPAPIEGPWRAALSVLPTDAFVPYAERIARARMGALAPPSGAFVLEAELAGPQQVTGKARLLGATPRPATLQVRDGRSREAHASARLVAMSGAPIDFALTLNAPYDPAAGPLLLEVAERVGAAALGPPLQLSAVLPEAAMRRRLSAVAEVARQGDLAAMDREIHRLRRAAPFSPQTWTVAVEAAMWRGDRAGAEGLLADLKQTARAISGAAAEALGETGDHLANRLAAASGDAASATEAALGSEPGSAPRSEPDAAPAVALAMAERFTDPTAIAAWLSELPAAHRRKALARIEGEAAFLAHRVLLAQLAPDLAPQASAWEALAAARLAAAEERVTAALAWLRAALERTPPSVHTAGSDIGAAICALCERIEAPAAWEIASELLTAASPDGALQPSPDLALRLAAVERRLSDNDPLRPQERLHRAALAAKRAAIEVLAADPEDRAARRALAGALSAGGQDGAAAAALRATYDARQDRGETSAGGGKDPLLSDLLAIEERAGHVADIVDLTALSVPPSVNNADAMDPVAVDPTAAAFRLRALRALERLDEATALAARCMASSDAALRREAVATVFFGGDFAHAEAAAEQALAERPRDRRIRLIAAAAAIERGEGARAEALLDVFDHHHGAATGAALADPLLLEARLLRCAADQSLGREDGCVDHLNRVFDALGAQRLRRRESATFGPDGLEPGDAAPADLAAPFGPAPLTQGPLVSVVMTAFNAADTIETAARSILAQRYRDLELIVVDDASGDATPDKVRALAAEDDRVRYVIKTVNEGAYVAKNQGLLEARGAYAAFQDADDWSHPDRIGKTVAALEAAPWMVGAAPDWLRMTTDGRLILHASAEIAQPCAVSLMIRREPALRRAGFFDSVRTSADLEYARRLRVLFGPRAVARLRWPLLIGRAHPQALSADPTSGVTRTGSSPPRRLYHNAATEWRRHIETGQSSGFMPFPQTTRPFPAPSTILP